MMASFVANPRNPKASMPITKRTSGKATILDVTGPILIGQGDAQLRQAVRSSLDEGGNQLILNMAGVTRIDSSGIGELISSYTTTTNRGGKLVLLDVPPKIQDILMITQLSTVFQSSTTRPKPSRHSADPGSAERATGAPR